jgi:hypothetical protein
MKSVLIGSLIGSIVLFLWGFAYWGLLPISGMVFVDAPPSLTQELRTLPRSGTYLVPGMDLYERDEAEFRRQHQTGPIATLYVRKEGANPGSPSTIGLGLLHMFVSVVLMGMLLRSVAGVMPVYGSRALFTWIAGSVGAFMADISPIIWWLQPAPLHVANLVYHVVGWGWVGLILARFVRPRAV